MLAAAALLLVGAAAVSYRRGAIPLFPFPLSFAGYHWPGYGIFLAGCVVGAGAIATQESELKVPERVVISTLMALTGFFNGEEKMLGLSSSLVMAVHTLASNACFGSIILAYISNKKMYSGALFIAGCALVRMLILQVESAALTFGWTGLWKELLKRDYANSVKKIREAVGTRPRRTVAGLQWIVIGCCFRMLRELGC